jgi:hypothetical protein
VLLIVCAPQVEQHLGPFLEAGALDELDINVVKAEGPKGRYKVQLSGIPDAPEGPVSLSDAKDRIIAWARTRQAAVPQGTAHCSVSCFLHVTANDAWHGLPSSL